MNTKWHVFFPIFILFGVLLIDVSTFLLLLFFWCLLSVVCVSIAYYFHSAWLFRKRSNGSIHPAIRWVFMPYLAGVLAYNVCIRSRDEVPRIQKIVNGLYIGARLTPRDIDNLQSTNIHAVLDMTAEFDGLGSFADSSLDMDYLNIPVLDHLAPKPHELTRACRWINNHCRRNKNVLVHCALGRGRSVLVVAAYLVATQREANLGSALIRIQGIRSTAGLNAHQYRKLDEWLAQDFSTFNFRPKLVIIANPVAGGGRWKVVREEVIETLDTAYNVKVKETSSMDNGTVVAREALREGVAIIVVCGGDGTVNEVADCLAGSEVSMGIIPTGTTNALSHALLGWPSKVLPISSACEAIMRGDCRTIDTAICNGERMLLIAGIGFEERMIHYANRSVKNRLGQLAYIKGFCAAVGEPKSVTLKVAFDQDEYVTVETTSFVVANAAPRFTVLAQGSGEPDFEDGFLDVTWISSNNDIADNLTAIGSLMFSEESSDGPCSDKPKNVHHKNVKEIRITSNDEFNYALDGELRAAKQLDISLQPKSLKLLSHNKLNNDGAMSEVLIARNNMHDRLIEETACF